MVEERKDGSHLKDGCSGGRTPKSFRGLSRKILTLATRAPTRHGFLREICQLLADLTACDIVELWLAGGAGQQEGWSYAPRHDVFCPLGLARPGSVDRGSARPVDGFPAACGLTLEFGEEHLGRIVLRSDTEDFFHPAKLELYQDVAQQLSVAMAYQRIQHSQRERVKELACLYNIARIAGQPDLELEALLTEVVAVLPQAWQYPPITVARIRVDGVEQASAAFEGALHRMRASFALADGGAGFVEVGYTEACPPLDEGPFLAEERHLIEAVAQEVGLAVQRKHTEAAQRSLEGQLQHADRLATIGQLAAGVAHELNEPLGSILGFSQLAGKAADLPEQVAQDLKRIEAAALYSREIVRKLKLFARQAPSAPRSIDLNETIEEGLMFLESRLAKQGIELQLHLGHPLPRILADGGQIVQILMNLGVNAAQAMDGGGCLRITTRSEEGQVVLEVSDDGPGIPDGLRTRVFEPFFTTKDVGEGTGLGLAVVHGIVSAHGGRIKLSDAPGGGARFQIHLPREEAHEQASPDDP